MQVDNLTGQMDSYNPLNFKSGQDVHLPHER